MNRKLLFLLCMAAVCFSAPRASAQYFSVGINAPMLASGTLNVTLEAAVAPHWSVELALLANPVSTERLGLTAAALQPGVRYWFFEEYAGHFLAMHAALASYNVWNASHRPQRMAFGGRDLLWLLLAALGTLEHDAGGRHWNLSYA